MRVLVATAVALACQMAVAQQRPLQQPGQGATGTLAPAIAGSGAPGGAAANRLARGDRRFLERVAGGSLAEVQASQEAAAKAEQDAVRRFAERLVADHGRLDAALQQLAAAKGVTLPTQPPRDQQRKLDTLGRLSGDAFDRAYVAQMVAAHRSDLSAFRDAARNARDADVKAFAAAQVPTLEEHLRKAQAIEAAAEPAR